MKFTNETSTEYIMLFPYIIPSIETKTRRNDRTAVELTEKKAAKTRKKVAVKTEGEV